MVGGENGDKDEQSASSAENQIPTFEKERAVELLKEAFSQGKSYRVTLHRDINLEPLWDYLPFRELLRPKG